MAIETMLVEDEQLQAPEEVYVKLGARAEPVSVAEELEGLEGEGVVAVYMLVTVGRKG